MRTLRKIAAAPLLCLLSAFTLYAQAPGMTIPANSKYKEFDVASVREDKRTDAFSANVPLGPGDVYTPTGGLFRATDIPLVIYIQFAYKLVGSQAGQLRNQLPDWVKTTNYDIEARADVQNGVQPTKDEMRIMVQKVLEDRFKFKMHTEKKDVAVYDLVPVKPGSFGPRFREHPAKDTTCPSVVSNDVMSGKEQPPADTNDGYPGACGGVLGMEPSAAGRFKFGGRNIGMALFTSTLSSGGLIDRPLINQTGITTACDFTLEFTPDNIPAGAKFTPDPDGPSFRQALQQQLGLTLKADKATVDSYVFDHIERPTDN